VARTMTAEVDSQNGQAPAEGGSDPSNMFTPVSGATVKSQRGLRPSKSQALFDAFLAAGMYAAELSADALNRASGNKLDANSLVSRLNSYAREKTIPVRVASGAGRAVFFVRLDRDENCNDVADWEAELNRTRRSGKDAEDSNI
jgi:hypothetical protein